MAALLDIRPGVTAVIGGGGKTTLLRALGEELSKAHSVLLCTTTKIFPFPGLPCAHSLDELETLRGGRRLLCAGREVLGTGKLTALDAPVEQMAERFDYVLVEADGSAGRPMKAHAPHEPVIPATANQVICVVGASGFGRPVHQAAHRAELYAGLAGVELESPVTPETEAAVLAKEALHHRIFVNQVETEEELSRASVLAELLDCPVAAGSLWKGMYISCSL